jgi:hypothetical protein
MRGRGSTSGRNRTSVIGRLAVIRVGGEQYVGNVLDCGPGGKAKRIRVQSPGARQGNVYFPNEYIFMEWVN